MFNRFDRLQVENVVKTNKILVYVVDEHFDWINKLNKKRPNNVFVLKQ